MRTATLMFAALIGLCSLQISAADLTAHLTEFFKARDKQHAAGMNVVIRTPPAQWPACDRPQFSLPGNSRQWGILSVEARCGSDRRYLQAQLQVTGSYVLTARQITRGTLLTAEDIVLRQGRLDTLPARTITQPQQAIQAISIRDLSPGQPITVSMLRPPWRIKTGQNVKVIARGKGFNATGEGRAMNNAIASQSVRVRMGNGQIVSGFVDRDDNILISL